MYQYFIKTPWWVKKLYSQYVWDIPTEKKEVFLSFDDGPHPDITPFVLNELKRYDALATFFCIGKNVQRHYDVYNALHAAGHSVGNHTQHHVNGWKTSKEKYLEDIAEAAHSIQSDLFRPPYGKIKRRQAKELANAMRMPNPKVIMWDVLSGDFDKNISHQQCLNNVLQHYKPGSIIVLHDSEKAFPHLKIVLPKLLQHMAENGYQFRALNREFLK